MRTPACGELVAVMEPGRPQFHGRVMAHDLHPMQDSFIQVEMQEATAFGFQPKSWVNLRWCFIVEDRKCPIRQQGEG